MQIDRHVPISLLPSQVHVNLSMPIFLENVGLPPPSKLEISGAIFLCDPPQVPKSVS